MNKFMFTGNIGKPFELKQVGKSCVTTISVGVEDSVKRDGKWTKETDWMRVTCWGNLAENLCKFCDKGSKVLVEGKVKNKEYTNKNGEKVRFNEVMAEKIEFLTMKKKEQESESSDVPF